MLTKYICILLTIPNLVISSPLEPWHFLDFSLGLILFIIHLHKFIDIISKYSFNHRLMARPFQAFTDNCLCDTKIVKAVNIYLWVKHCCLLSCFKNLN